MAERDDDLAMPWTKREYPNSRVNRAGDVISERVAPSNISMEDAMEIAGNWRSAHGWPLHYMYREMVGRAKKVDPKFLSSKRQKRMPSIISKLKRFPGMQLSRMQDLGGCRAVVANIQMVNQLVASYESHPPERATLHRKCDYIAAPKDDGYRSVHLIYKYQGESQCGAFKGMNIEVQIRTKEQHAWATAVETIDAFTGQGLKSDLGEEPWARFFVLVSQIFAIFEKRPVPPNTPSNGRETIGELEGLCRTLKIPDVFKGLTTGLHMIEEEKTEKANAYVLTLDSKERSTRVFWFSNVKAAERLLLDLEKENAGNPHVQTVLAFAKSVKSLRSAYPSYYADTHFFIRLMEELLKRAKKQIDKS